ncbi:MAG: ABC transporter substrate-binding protein [Desulfosarcina sp.]|nr:ABC transporter substrate-binding protein [Desulfosarcina sp.]MBC2767209.1 ABC transporter substrate-binding protein [Desulfosarcina sp.]
MKVRKFFISLMVTVMVAAPILAFSAELKIGFKSEPSSMDPHYHNLSPNNMIAQNTFDKLIKQDEKQNLKPGLAVSWKPLDDVTWEIKLRKGVTFHDGSPFTAEDVKFTMERAPKVPNSPSSFSRYIKFIKTVEIVDPTGPYKFVEWVPGDRIVFTKNDAYWGEKEPWDKVIIKPISNASARVAALLAGDVDLINFVPTADIDKLKKDPEFKLAQSVSNRVIYLHIDSDRDESPFVTDKKGKHMKKNPLKDLRVRKAISKAINRDAIVAKVMEGHAIPAGQLLPDGFFAISPKLKPEKFDPEGAKKLLAEAGWKDGFGLTIHGPNNRYVNDAKICQAVAQMLARIGIDTKVDTMPKNVFFPRGSKLEFSLLLVGWGSGTGEPSSPLGALLHTYDKEKGLGNTNRGRFSNKALDATLQEALRTVDRKKHEELLIKATEIAIENLGIIPLHYQVAIWAMRDGISYVARTDEYTLPTSVRAIK